MAGPGVVEAIASALSFGIGDFTGGLGARRIPGAIVAAGSQLVGAVLLVAVLALVRTPAPAPGDLLLGALSGASGGLGLMALYRGLSLGSMGLVAAISGAGSVSIPLLATLLLYATPLAWPKLVGVALTAVAIGAAGLASGRGGSRRALGFALLAAVGFGGWYVLLDRAALGDALWALTSSRVAAASTVGALALLLHRRDVLRRGVSAWRLVALAGVLDVGGNGLFVLARAGIPVGVAAALSGLYPLVTMLCARVVLRETIPAIGLAGIGLAACGIVLISLG